MHNPSDPSPRTPLPTDPALQATHALKVARIAAEVRARAAERRAGAPQTFASLGKAQVSHMVPNPRDPRHRDRKINARDLNQILSLDAAAQRCTAESGVAFCDLVQATLKQGLMPTLVPELKTITLGGAVSGCSVESMSYRRGGFHDACLSYEVITGAGEVLRCSPEEDAELFHMLHGSYGTLGILTALTFPLIPAKPYVHLTYERYPSFARFLQAMYERQQDPGVDFIDGIIHAPDLCVLCVGRMVDAAPAVSDYTGQRIYYQSTRERAEDHLTTFDYLFRYDTECHWLSRTVPGLEHPLVRRALRGVLLGSTNLLRWSARLRPVLRLQRRPPVVVDVFIPSARVEEFFTWYKDRLSYYPLWIVPYRVPAPYPWIAPAHAARMGDLFIDCAIYGKANDTPGVDYSELLEQKTFELGGIKTLISRNHYDEERFWSVYDRDRYQAIKRRADPHNLLRDLYEKFAPAR